MRNTITFLFSVCFAATFVTAQVKIGDNPQNIDPSSVLELESTDKVLVITRLTTVQMNAITPNAGALCYNTDLQSVHYYNGTQWLNLGVSGGTGGPLTADAIVNAQPTIVITPTASGDNLEVAPNSIRTEQIVDGGVNGVDIQDGSIGPGKLQNLSVTEEKLSENSVGTFALDNDNIGVSAFNNDAGYITAADIGGVSADANNSLEDRADGPYYSDQLLVTAINQNTNAIALDNDQSPTNEIQNLIYNATTNSLAITSPPAGAVPVDLSGLKTNISEGTNIDITGDGSAATPYIINATGGETGGTDDQNMGAVTLNASNILSIGIENGDPSAVDLSALISDGSETKFNDSPTISVAGSGTTVDPYVLTGTGGADGSETVVTGGTNITITGNGTTATPYIINATGGGTGGTDDQNMGAVTLNASNILSIGIENGDPSTVDLSALAGGGGADDQNLETPTLNAANVLTLNIEGGNSTNVDLSPLVSDGSETVVTPGTNITITGNGTVATPYVINAVGGGAGTTELIDDITLEGIGTAADPFRVKPGAANQILRTANDGNSVTWVDLPVGGAVISDATLTGDGSSAATELGLADNAVTLEKINQNGASADGDIMKWNTTLNAGAGGWEVGVNAGHVGTAKAIFYADTDGTPTTAFNPNEGDITSAPSLVWDPTSRLNSGQLQIGLDGKAAPGDVSKVVIAETPSGGSDVMFPLLLQTLAPGSANSSTGILFSPETHDPATLAKGALIYQRTGAWARGDFHFLQKDADGAVLPATTDKAFSIKNNKDIVIYGGIEIDGLGLGTNGEVLTSTGTGVQWSNGGGATTDTDGNDGLSDFTAGSGYNINVDDTTIELNADALRIKPATIDPATPVDQILVTDETSGNVEWQDFPAGNQNLSTANLVQPAASLLRTYELTNANQSLVFTGAGNVGIGNGANPPANKLHVGGAIRAEGILNSQGIAGEPSYRFSGDINTGMYLAAADDLGFSAGGETPLRVKHTATDGREVIVDASIELKEQLLDKDGEAGTSGQILSSTATATDWIEAPEGVTIKARVAAATGTNGSYNIPISGQTTANYIINVSVVENTPGNPIMIQIVGQTAANFSVQIYEFIGGVPTPANADWFYTIYNP